MIVAEKQIPVVVEASAFAAKMVRKKGSNDDPPRQSGSNESTGRYCEKCNLTNHSTKYCRAHIVCSYCNGKGHSVDYCRTKRRHQEQGSKMAIRANAVTKSSPPDLSGLGLSTKDCDNMLGSYQG